jgi:hypothetical protein
MPGLGRRTFAPGEVLTATNVMGYLQDQAVMNFAGTAARGSAIGTAVSEGMVSYLADTNLVEVYDGSAWKAIAGVSNNILQIVSSQTTTATTTTSTTFVSITGMSATITPTRTTSRILVLVNVPINSLRSGGSGNNYANGEIRRAGTQIVSNFGQTGVLNTADMRGNITSIMIDSPSTTSSTTYDFRGASTFASSVVFIPDGTTGSITLMELGA